MLSRSVLNQVSLIRSGTASMRSPRRAQFSRLARRLRDYGDEQTQNEQADRRDVHLIRDWRGSCLETDLSRHVVAVRMGHTWQKRRRKPKLRGNKPVPKVSMTRAADRLNLKKWPSRRGRYGAPFISSSIL
jgi:hypothetical protein